MNITRHENRDHVFQIEYTRHEPAYSVTFADLPAVITSGDSLSVAISNACEALNLHLESLQKLGKRFPNPKHTLTVEST